eukprot:m.81163 g.81163  ORF g.81163 m.81163 type:complete len:552 (+) comp12795_c0_seq3:281-1936(+)
MMRDLYAIAREYVRLMTDDTSKRGPKCLLLDRFTTTAVSMVTPRSTLLQRGVYLFQRIDGNRGERLQDVQAIVFIRPCEKSIKALETELQQPRFKSYNIYFSNVTEIKFLRRLAKADKHELVRVIQECYLDFHLVDAHLFTCDLLGCCGRDSLHQWNPSAFDESASVLHAVVNAMGCTPAFRFQSSSPMCEALASQVRKMCGHAAATPDRTLVLVLDRRDDPVTPLLAPWTYQAMIHECIEIKNGTVRFNAEGSEQQLQLISGQDDFYRSIMFLFYEDYILKIKALFDDAKQRRNVVGETVEEMKKFVQSLPELRETVEKARKHVALAHMLKQQVNKRSWMDQNGILDAELSIIETWDHSTSLSEVLRITESPDVDPIDKLRVALLHLLRHESKKSKDLGILTNALSKALVSSENIEVLKLLLLYCGKGASGRKSDCFNAASTSLFKRQAELDAGITHTPLLAQTLDNIAKGKIDDSKYKVVKTEEKQAKATGPPRNIILFMVGGTTYEESSIVDKFNEENRGSVKAILGSTYVHNMASFLKEIKLCTQPQ